MVLSFVLTMLMTMDYLSDLIISPQENIKQVQCVIYMIGIPMFIMDRYQKQPKPIM